MWPFNTRTGNGTWVRQKLYCMINFPFIWIWKIGITGRPILERSKQVTNSVGWGIFIPIAWVNMIGAYQLEQYLLRKTKKFRVTMFGRGGKELRFIFPGVLLWLLIALIGICKRDLPYAIIAWLWVKSQL